MDHIRYFERGNTQVPVQMYKEIILQLVVYRRKRYWKFNCSIHVWDTILSK